VPSGRCPAKKTFAIAALWRAVELDLANCSYGFFAIRCAGS